MEPTSKPVPLDAKPIGSIYADSVPIFLHEQVLDEVLAYSEQDLRRELGGFLLGGYHRDVRTYVEIRRFWPAVDATSRAASLTFTHDTWSKLHRDVERQFPDEMVVGWQHTHPNMGLFLSGYDLFIQQHFFRQPWQVAMVVDPCRREFEFFQWRGGEIVDCGFYLLPAARSSLRSS
ncbi:MAG: Mov34/MPN/PAD-1 family protein [Planctomycetales bacterium]|nr:Mov34/MPN/PAD-1 family protein [Planctomycetales bacterium]